MGVGDHVMKNATGSGATDTPMRYTIATGPRSRGTIGDGGTTLDALTAQHGVTAGSVDFLFIDHDKSVYLADLQSILARGWLRPGSIALADNMGLPGSPKYRAYMREQEGRQWRTDEHHAHVEYQTLAPDLMLESEFLGQAAAGLNP